MRKYIVVSALTATLVTVGLVLIAKKAGWLHSGTFRIEQVQQTPVQSALYTLDDKGNPIPLDFTATAEKVTNAVVHIKSTQTAQASRQGQMPEDYFGGNDLFERFFGPQFRFETPEPRDRSGAGSGVIISDDGYIVTNNHVISNADEIEVTLNDNRSFKAKLIGTDPTTDIALLRIDADKLPNLVFSNSDNVRVGEWVMAVGNPFNLNSTVTVGIVSAKARNINILREQQHAIESFIQTDAAINPGNSGGALVDLDGRVIGINTAIASPTGSYSGYGFAIPSNIVSKVVQDFIEYGSVQRGFIGAMIRSVDNALAKEQGLKIIQGVFVENVVEDGAADKAGIKAGDVITAVNEKPTNTASALLEAIGRQRPGDKLKITVNRKGDVRNYDVVLKNQSGSTERIREELSTFSENLGADLATISNQRAEDLEISGGVEIKKLKPGKLRRQTTIKEGFIITHVNDKPIRSVKELDLALSGKKGGVMLSGIYPGENGQYYYAIGLE